MIAMYALLIVALASSTPEQAAMDQVKQKIAYDLKDPDSAKFRNVRAGLRGKDFMVCGEVNAKNSYGAYIGYKPFMSWAGVMTVANETIDPVTNRAMLNTSLNLCSNILDKGAPAPVPDGSGTAETGP